PTPPPRSTLFPYTTLFRSGGLHALHHHAERVADEDDVDAGFVGDAAEREVIGRQRHDRVAAAFVLQNVRNCDLTLHERPPGPNPDRKSTRLNSSHLGISYA